MPHKGNWLYLLDFWILDNKKVSGDSWDTSADPHRVQDKPWSVHGPYRVLKMDLMISEPISGSVYHFYIVYYQGPLPIWKHFFGHCVNLSGLKGPSWTLMDPLMDPKMDPARLISGDPW